MVFTPALPNGVDLQALLKCLRKLSWGACDILLAYSRGEKPPYGFPEALTVEEGGEGPVSAADLSVNKWLLNGFKSHFPQAGWELLSEETAKDHLSDNDIISKDWLWILDPLDGTKDFIQGTSDYAMHLALNYKRKPYLGIVLLPEKNQL